MSKKPLSKKELKARKAEQNKDKRKKIDYRQFANKFFRNPTNHLPLIMSGIGPGKTSYCYDCRSIVSAITIKENGITSCDRCGNNNIEVREKNPSWQKKLCWRLKELHYNWRNRK